MNEKEFRKLRRAELVEIIYQLEKDLEDLKIENASLHKQLDAQTAQLEKEDFFKQAAERLNQLCETTEKYMAEMKQREEERRQKELEQQEERKKQAIYDQEIQEMEALHRIERKKPKINKNNVFEKRGIQNG